MTGTFIYIIKRKILFHRLNNVSSQPTCVSSGWEHLGREGASSETSEPQLYCDHLPPQQNKNQKTKNTKNTLKETSMAYKLNAT